MGVIVDVIVVTTVPMRLAGALMAGVEKGVLAEGVAVGNIFTVEGVPVFRGRMTVGMVFSRSIITTMSQILTHSRVAVHSGLTRCLWFFSTARQGPADDGQGSVEAKPSDKR